LNKLIKFFSDYCDKKTALKDVSPNITWNGILVIKKDSAQKFSY